MSGDIEFYRGLIDSMTDGVYIVDRNRLITYWSAGAARMTGFPAEAVIGRSCQEAILNHVDDSGHPLCTGGCPLAATLLDGHSQEVRLWMHHADGHRQPVWVRSAPIRDTAGTVNGVVEVFSDDTAMAVARRRMVELEELALVDPLTGLGNRRYAMMQLAARRDEFVRYGWRFGVLFVDIDHFKRINDEYGHDAGDDCLKMVAHTMSYALRDSDVISRYGGEEFVAVIARADPQTLAVAAERLRALVASSWLTLGHRRVKVTVSIGGALTLPADDLDTLLHRADSQMYVAKNAGRNRVVIAPDAVLETNPNPQPAGQP